MIESSKSKFITATGEWRELSSGREVKPRRSVYGVCVIDGRILLTRPSWSEKWELPGGGIEDGEDLISAMKREFEEETGHCVPDQEFRPLGTHREKFYIESVDKFYDSLLNYFGFSEIGSQDESLLDDDTVAVSWLELESVDEASVHRNTWRIIQEMLGDKPSLGGTFNRA